MNQVLDKSKTLNCITIFSLISFLGTLLSGITYFVTYSGDYIDGEWVNKCIIRFPTLLGFLYLLADIAPCILLVLYILKFHKKFKAKIFMSIIFATFLFTPLLIIVESIVYHYTYNVLIYILYLAQFITFLIATISALKGFSKKLFPIIALCVGIVLEAYLAINFFTNITTYVYNSMFLYLFTRAMRIVGITSLFVTLFLLLSVLIVSPEKEKKNAEKMNPEQRLKLLKDKLDLGMISDKEYQVQRAEIISKL